MIEIRRLLPHIHIMTFMEGVLKEAGTAYLSRAPGLTPGIWWGHVAFFCYFSVLCLFCLRHVSRVPNVAIV